MLLYFVYAEVVFKFIFGCAGSPLVLGLSLAAATGGCPLAAVLGLPVAVAPPVVQHGL